MNRAFISIANFALVASLTKPIVPDYIESLKSEQKEHDDSSRLVHAESTNHDEELKAHTLKVLTGRIQGSRQGFKCVGGPYVEDVSQAECQQRAVEHRHSFYQYRDDQRRCATIATCNTFIPGKMWNIFKIAEPGPHREEMKQTLDADHTLGDEDLKAQALWPQYTKKAKCVDGPYVEVVSQSECQLFAVEHRHSYYQYRDDKRICATSTTCNVTIPGKMWNIFKLAEPEAHGEYMKQNLDVEWTEDIEELNVTLFPFDVFDMHKHTRNPGGEGDCRWRCDNHDRCVRYEWDADMLFCKMFEKAPTARQPRTQAAPSATASIPKPVVCTSCDSTGANNSSDSRSSIAPTTPARTSSNSTPNAEHTALNATSHTTSNATLIIAPDNTSRASSNASSKITYNVTSRTVPSAPPSTVPNAASYTASNARSNTTPNATAYTIPSVASNTTTNSTSHPTPHIIPSTAVSRPTPNATFHTTSNTTLETAANATSYTTTNTSSNISFLATSTYMDVNPNDLPLSEEGYQAVAALKDDEAMLRYVRRDLHTLGLRSLSESELKGWVPYFSGTTATQSRKVMLEELHTKKWVDELPLSEQAYQKVAALKDDEAMLRYVRRELDAHALRSLSESELRGWVPYFSGTKATRNRKVMLDELRAREWVSALPLSEESYQKVAALKSDEAMLQYVRHELHALGLRSLSESELRGWVPYFSGTKATRSREVMLDELRTKEWVGELPLSEESYQKVAALKDDEAMLRYVRRELDAQALRSLSESELRGWVPYFSGTKATRNRNVMLDELRTKEWVGEPPLSEEGYQKVAALKNDDAMLRYVRRELDALGRRAKSEGALKGWVSYFSGTKATRSRAVMLDELHTQEWVVSNAKMGSYAEQKKLRQLTQ